MAKFNEKQQLAIDIRNINTLVSAGAGSGKTTVLSERVISLLKDNYDLSRILILTFTNNAAANMQSRIQNKILQDDSLKDFEKLVAGADIMTFDAFNHKLAKKYAYKLGLENGYSIIDETIVAVIKRNYLKDRFEKFIQDENPLFISLLDKFTNNNYNPILDWIISTYDKIDIEVDPKKVLSELIDNPLNIDISNIYSLIFIKAKQLFDNFISSSKELLIDRYNKYYDYLDEVNNKFSSYSTYDEFHLAFKEFKLKSFIFKDDEESKAIYKNIKDQYYSPLRDLNKIMSKENFKVFYKGQKDVLSFLYNLIYDLKTYIDSYKDENRVYSFQDIAHKVLNLIKSDRDIQNDLKKHYQEIMVDEYQDNSDLQEEMINLLDNNNLFLVGDIKQSIYRFRHANPKLFLNRYKDYKEGNKKGFVIDMNQNYRSSMAVIEDVNKIFSKIMSEEFGGASYDDNQAMIASNPIYKDKDYKNFIINVSPDGDLLENEITAIADDIKLKMEKENYNYNDFAIILDRSTSFNDVIRFLTAKGIPVAADYNGSIISLDFSLLLIDLLKIVKGFEIGDISSEEFKHAYVAISRSYLIENNDNDIYQRIVDNSYLNDSWVKEIKNIYQSNIGKTVLQIYLLILDHFKILEKIIKGENYKDDLNVLELFKSHIEQLENLHYSFEDTVEYFKTLQNEDLVPKGRFISGKVNAVTLINIHMSKGLEYQHCYFPQLHKKYVEKSFQTSLQYSQTFGLICGITEDDVKDNLDNKSNENPLLYLYGEEEKNQSRQERIRLLYVALTRAKHGFTFVRSKESNSIKNVEDGKTFDEVLSYSGIYPYLTTTESAITQNSNKIIPEEIKDYGFKYLDLNISFKKKEETNKASKSLTHASYETLLFGTRMHEILESLDLKNPDLTAIKNSRYKTAISNFLKQDFLKDIDKCDVYQEYAFSDKIHNTTGIIDLLLVYKDKVKIIDYKLKNIDDPDYLKQLNVYKEYIETLTDLPISLYLYSIIDHSLVAI